MPNSKFQKPFISNASLLDSTVGDPDGYVTKDGIWAAVPFGNKFIIIHNGSQVKVLNTYKQSVDFINNQRKTTKKKSRK